jgi:hypothetical protein
MTHTMTAQLAAKFYLPAQIKANLDTHYLLHWQGSYLLSQLTPEGETDTIERAGVIYTVHTVPELTPWDIIQNPKDQYKISFRKLACASTGVALIKKAGT